MYTISEVVEIDTAQNFILDVGGEKTCGLSDDVFPLQPVPDADFDE
jgi:hypothetical protein